MFSASGLNDVFTMVSAVNKGRRELWQQHQCVRYSYGHSASVELSKAAANWHAGVRESIGSS